MSTDTVMILIALAFIAGATIGLLGATIMARGSLTERSHNRRFQDPAPARPARRRRGQPRFEPAPTPQDPR